jgi:aryl-alcohol dehydrogenase-like predicted oxidoreductase
MARVALAWVLRKPGVSAPIVGATKIEQLDEAAAAVSLQLSDEDVAELEASYLPHAVAGFR